MSSINIISSYIPGQIKPCKKGAVLSEETLAKMLFYGLDIESVSSEAEAKKLIAEEEKKRNAQKADKTEEKNPKSKEQNILEAIKTFAKRIGVILDDNETPDKMFNKISKRLEELEKNPYNSDLNVFKAEFEILKQQYMNKMSGTTSILSAMDALSMSNRAALGI